MKIFTPKHLFIILIIALNCNINSWGTVVPIDTGEFDPTIDYTKVLNHRNIHQDFVLKAILQYAILNHNKLIIGMRDIILEYWGGPQRVDLLFKKATDVIVLMAQNDGWKNVINKINQEFNQKILPDGPWIVYKNGYEGNSIIYPGLALGIFIDLMFRLRCFEKMMSLIYESNNSCGSNIWTTFYNTSSYLTSTAMPNDYNYVIKMTINKNPELAEQILLEFKNNQPEEALRLAIENQYPTIVQYLLKQGVLPTQEHLQLVKNTATNIKQRYWNFENAECLSDELWNAFEMNKEIYHILQKRLKLTTKYGLISSKGIIGLHRLPEEIVDKIAQILYE